MWIIGCDYHPSMQQIAWVDTESGECGERRLRHRSDAEQFYRQLQNTGTSVRVGMEATGHSRSFERLLAELIYELWMGDPATIAAKRVRKQRNDRRDAQHILTKQTCGTAVPAKRYGCPSHFALILETCGTATGTSYLIRVSLWM